ncbi:Gfo/Idh/MocA family protein [Rhizohabitans arisaemae]|uniref:Gfo/Idh/MocA family protein n=1 Tax=Rhizohabitans arisaemae TaxID=2720610 RepID=UPI0024B26406|nr:Gfo/Idh/MocA family oxidoreductase [Rhizohabitans arisaemae]
MGDRVRVGLAGVGIIAQTHLEVLAALPVSLEFTVDPNLAEPPVFRGTTPSHYRDLADALTAHQPDLVVIATPTETHADLVAQALRMSPARVLAEKPLVHDPSSLDRLRSMNDADDLRGRLFTAHHFAFSPEVGWAEEVIDKHPEWGPVTQITSAFYDPYILRGDQAFASYVSSWMDSGVNQLSMLARFVDLLAITSGGQTDGGSSAWYTFSYRCRGVVGTARLRTSWLTGSSSKKTVLTFGQAGVEVWIDHTAMTGFASRDDVLLAVYGNDGRTPRKVAHYRPLYESLLSDQPDPVLGFDVAETVVRLQHAVPPA